MQQQCWAGRARRGCTGSLGRPDSGGCGWRRRCFAPLASGKSPQQAQQQQQRVDSSKVPTAGALLGQAASRALGAGLAALLLTATPPPAEAVLAMPRGQLPRTAEIALRRAVPAFNPEVKEIQNCLEDIALKLRIPQRKPWNGMKESLDAAVAVAADRPALLAGVLPPNEAQAQELIGQIQLGLGRLSEAVANKDPDRTSLRVAGLLRQVSELELLQAPGLPFNVPRQYAGLPRLTGRAVVEMAVRRESREALGTLRLILDGYSAPLTAGNFLANVEDGLYNGAKLSATYNSVLVGEPDSGPTAPAIPLEFLVLGEFEPVYRTPLDVLGGEQPVLPLSINGALAMAQLGDSESADGISRSANGLVSARQFFIHKFERSQAGLAGLSFDEGQFSVFGYVVEGEDLLEGLGAGDTIASARVLSGSDKLVRPAPPASAAVAAVVS